MTKEQLETARKYIEYHKKQFGHSNVEFHEGYIEDLSSCGVKDGTVDVLISNCVVNLSPKKDLVFKEIARVLKEGGELYFSDIYCDRRIPSHLAQNKVKKYFIFYFLFFIFYFIFIFILLFHFYEYFFIIFFFYLYFYILNLFYFIFKNLKKI